MIVLSVVASFASPSIYGSWSTIEGKQIVIKKSNQFVLLDYWASWCVACRGTVPKLLELQKQYPQLKIIGVNTDDAQDLEKALKFTKATKMNFPSIIDIPDQLSTPLKVDYLPTLILFNDKGKEVFRTSESADLLNTIKPYLISK